MGPLPMRVFPRFSVSLLCVYPLTTYVVLFLMLCSTVFKKFAYQTAAMIDMFQSLASALLACALLLTIMPLAMLLEFRHVCEWRRDM